MTLQELIIDLKAAGANDNTLHLALNCYELGRMEVVYAHTNETVQRAIAIEREACAKVADAETRLSRTSLSSILGDDAVMHCHVAAAIRARGQQ